MCMSGRRLCGIGASPGEAHALPAKSGKGGGQQICGPADRGAEADGSCVRPHPLPVGRENRWRALRAVVLRNPS